MNNPLRKFSVWLFGGVNPRIKAVFFVVIAVFAGHLCDEQYQANFPIFKITFALVGLMMYVAINKKPEDGGEGEKE